MQLILYKNLEKNLYWGVRVVHPFVCGWFVSCDGQVGVSSVTDYDALDP